MVVREHENAVHGGDAEQRNEPDGRGDAERCARHPQSKDAAQQRHGNDAGGEQRVAQAAEVQIEQEHDQRDRKRHGDAQARDGILQIAEFAHPFEAVAARQ